ncbi:hypothetical protein ABEF95_013951 [Exophiala dermatitidis]
MAPRKIIIGTDPGVDDILAILLAFSALPEKLQVLLISVTYGNIDVQNCLRNVIPLLYHVEKEIRWRESVGRSCGFETLRKSKPVVAVGPEGPLTDNTLMADFLYGRDRLGRVRSSRLHLTPSETWEHVFEVAIKSTAPEQGEIAEEMNKMDSLFSKTCTFGDTEIFARQ